MKRKAAATGTMALCVSALLLLASAATASAQDDAPPEPAGYWQGAMNGRVPATISGGTVIVTKDLAELIATEKPVLVDVVPAPRRPPGQTTGWLPLPHRNIPGSVWIPGLGSGVISTEMKNYAHRRLEELTGHDSAKLIVVYCRANCWASWNAAKRVIVEGYPRVYWYPDGIEAWQDAGLSTKVVSPEGPGVE
jgi:PQQ-dependent catabolism-associated CXXCW motif protein